jgi:hypothetical protein
MNRVENDLLINNQHSTGQGVYGGKRKKINGNLGGGIGIFRINCKRKKPETAFIFDQNFF